MKRAKDDLDWYIEMRLEEWASWCAGNINSIGFSRKNILAKLADEGGMLGSSSYLAEQMPNLNAVEIEKLYSYLFVYNKKSAVALRIRYHSPQDFEHKARQQGYSKTQYYHYLQMAHEWLRGFFYARKQF